MEEESGAYIFYMLIPGRNVNTRTVIMWISKTGREQKSVIIIEM